MANLSNEEAIKLIKTPQYAAELRRAKDKKVRHALHTEAETEDVTFRHPAHTRFLLWVERLLDSEENFRRFKSLYRPPLITNEFTESIFSQFQKIFEAENPFEKFSFKNPELEGDFAEYRRKIGDLNFWETQGFETFQNSIDNVLVVDLPRLDPEYENRPAEDYPRPYYYILDIHDIIDLCNTRVKSSDPDDSVPYYFKTEYVIFRDKANEVCVFDDTFYRRYLYGENQSEPTLLGEPVAHGLGYCPARSFWTTPLNSKTNILKANPITKSLSELDWLLFYDISAKYLKLYAPFPIYAVYKGRCNYKDQATDKKCIDGYLYPFNTSNQAPIIGTSRIRCPRCSNKMRTGAGNIIELPVPQEDNKHDLMANPIKVIGAEETSVATVNEEINTKKQNIYAACVGIGGDEKNDQAKNELQIEAGFESQTNVLLKGKRNFEIIKLFALETIARLRYQDQFISGTLDLGDQFFVTDDTAELEEYQKGVAAKLPSYDLQMRRDKINATRYRNQPDQYERYNILKNVDPFPDMDIDAVLNLADKKPDLIDPLELLIKVNLNRFIARFERENADINVFASNSDFDKKINLIKDRLIDYAKELNAQKIVPNPAAAAPATV